MKNINITLILMITLTGYHCTKTNEREPPDTPSEVLNEKVRSAPYQFINLDEPELKEINLTDSDIIYQIGREIADNEPLIGNLFDAILINDEFYIYDLITSAIFKVDMQGNIDGPLTREGRGPGEHNTAAFLNSNELYIYATDFNSARINRYLFDMVPVEPLDDYLPNLSFIDLNDDIILSGNKQSSGFTPEDPDQGLITINSVDNLADTLATIMPRWSGSKILKDPTWFATTFYYKWRNNNVRN